MVRALGPCGTKSSGVGRRLLAGNSQRTEYPPTTVKRSIIGLRLFNFYIIKRHGLGSNSVGKLIIVSISVDKCL